MDQPAAPLSSFGRLRTTLSAVEGSRPPVLEGH
jgi:hypothetical protein